MVAGDDDFVIGPGPLDLTLPPRKSFGGHRASRRSAAAGLAADRVWQVITITHHQHTDVAELEGVTLPGAVDRIRTLGIVDKGCLGMLPERIGPFAEPPVRLLALARWDAVGRCVMIARNIINLLASMLLQNGVLPNDLSTLFILGRVPEARIVTEVERNVPRNARPADGTAFLRLAQCFRHRFWVDWRRSESDHAMLNRLTHCLVGADMRVGDDPKLEDCCLFVSRSGRRLGSGAEPAPPTTEIRPSKDYVVLSALGCPFESSIVELAVANHHVIIEVLQLRAGPGNLHRTISGISA